jgi:DNA-binding CsgD family transcriptional regulator
MLFWYGEWDEMDRVAREWASHAGSMSTRMVGLGLGMAARHRGNFDEAWTWVHAALKPRFEESFGDCWCELAMQAQRLAADLALDAGDLDGAERWIRIHAQFLEQSGAKLGRSQHHALEARYCELLGNDERALAHARQSLRYASHPHQPLDRLMALRYVGRLLSKRDAFTEAEEHLSASYELATRCAARFEVALTSFAQAELLAKNSKRAAARHKLAEAREIAADLRAEPLLQQLSELSDSLTDHDAKRARPDGLSPREIEVLQLVARGLTDAEIAEQLFLSPRTVSGHLQSIYNKLSISSRAAATAYAFRQNLV